MQPESAGLQMLSLSSASLRGNRLRSSHELVPRRRGGTEDRRGPAARPGAPAGPGRGVTDSVAGICPCFQDPSMGTSLRVTGQHVSAPSALCALITSLHWTSLFTRQHHPPAPCRLLPGEPRDTTSRSRDALGPQVPFSQ